MEINSEQKIILLKIARDTITDRIAGGEMAAFETEDELLNEPRGVFVTLHKNGRLRGCIGNILPKEKLWMSVRNMAVESAFSDPRFSPLSAREIFDIDIEISVLTVPRKVASDEIRIGRDGVIVVCGVRQGVYLPQVAEETGWGLEEFMSSLCCSKAGLSPDAWKDSCTELYTFQAEVFGEIEMGLI